MSEANLVTLVTAYFPLGGKAKHAEAKYEEWINYFLAYIATPLVVFTSKEYAPRLRAMRPDSNYPMHIIEQTIEEFYVSNIFTLEEWDAQYCMDPEKNIHNIELYKIWCEKSSWLQQTIQKNPFASKWFFWVDIGCWRVQPTVDFTHWPNVQLLETLPSDRVVLLQVGNFDQNEIDLCSSVDPVCVTYPSQACRIGGGIFGGQGEAVNVWADKFYKQMILRRDQRQFMGKDQLVMADIVLNTPSSVVVVVPPANFDGDYWFYLQIFLNAKKEHLVNKAIESSIATKFKPLGISGLLTLTV